VDLDLQQDAKRLVAAYDDSAGVAASFARNLFARMNRDLETNVPLRAIKHVIEIKRRPSRVEIFAEVTRPVIFDFPGVSRRFWFSKGQRIQTETWRNFTLAGFTRTLARHGLRRRWFSIEPQEGYALVLLMKPHPLHQHASRLKRGLARLSRPRLLEA
jgi:L-histidine N-alpha-methyltransferase